MGLWRAMAVLIVSSVLGKWMYLIQQNQIQQEVAVACLSNPQRYYIVMLLQSIMPHLNLYDLLLIWGRTLTSRCEQQQQKVCNLTFSLLMT